VKVGDILQPGQVGIAIARQHGFAFEAVVASEDVAHLQSGMPARIKLDSYPYQKYGTLDGVLHFVSPDSKVNEGTATYKVKIVLTQDEVGRGQYRGPIKLGMTGQAEIVIEKESLLRLLMRRIRHTISLG
jgi:HlyD family secretion protein